MSKILCLTLETGTIGANSYRGPSGIEYLFQKGCPAEVNNKADEKHFLKAGNGKFFEKVGVISKIKNKIVKPKNIVEDPSPREEVEEYKELPVETVKYAEQELIDMNKQEQADLIEKLSPGTKVPRLEKNRVALIIKLQTEAI